MQKAVFSMTKIFRGIGILLFLGFLSFGFIGLSIGPNVEAIRQSEQQLPAKWPRLVENDRVVNLKQWCGSVVHFLDQRILFRAWFIRGNIRAKHFLGDSAFPNKVILGKEEWLFLGNEFNNSLNNNLGVRKFSDADLLGYFEKIQDIKKICDKDNRTFVFVIAPNKEVIYSEYMPDWFAGAIAGSRPENLIESKNRDDLPILNLTHWLLAAKGEYSQISYQKQDTHWNSLGAYQGYLGIMTFLKKEKPSLTALINGNLVEVPKSYSGDLRNMLMQEYPMAFDPDWRMDFQETKINSQYYSYDIDYYGTKKKQPVHHIYNILQKEGLIKTWNDKALNNKKVLLIADSFGEHMTPYFAATFARMIVIHRHLAYTPKSIEKLIQDHNPDIVIFEQVARTL